MKIHLFYPQAASLYQLLHSDDRSEYNFNNILRGESIFTRIRIKYEIAFQIAKILLTMHNLSSIKHHGHLTSHNIFVDLKKIASGTFEVRVRIADIETFDFMEYGNIFFNYRISSVWSSPEVLKYQRKILDITTQMDVYSFGMILWELWHQSIPFDNNIKQAIQYVVKEESRPKIVQSISDIDKEEEEKEEFKDAISEQYDSLNSIKQDNQPKYVRTYCDPIVSSLIRKCWTNDPNQRPKVFEICQLLHSKIQKDLSQDVVIVKV